MRSRRHGGGTKSGIPPRPALFGFCIGAVFSQGGACSSPACIWPWKQARPAARARLRRRSGSPTRDHESQGIQAPWALPGAAPFFPFWPAPLCNRNNNSKSLLRKRNALRSHSVGATAAVAQRWHRPEDLCRGPQLLEWVNSFLGSDYSKIEQLCDGAPSPAPSERLSRTPCTQKHTTRVVLVSACLPRRRRRAHARASPHR